MSPKPPHKPLIALFLLLLLQALITATSALPPTNPHFLPPNNNKTTTNPPTASTPLQEPTPHNASLPPNMFDYHIVGTSLILRITDTGAPLTRTAVNRVIDAGIRRVVAKINEGSGKHPLDAGRFWQLSAEIDLRINALGHGELTYFLLGDVLAGAWQYMCQPWSCFREIAFDIIFDGEVWIYIGYGRFQRSGPGPEPPPPEPSSSSSSSSSFLGRDGNLVLDEIE